MVYRAVRELRVYRMRSVVSDSRCSRADAALPCTCTLPCIRVFSIFRIFPRAQKRTGQALQNCSACWISNELELMSTVKIVPLTTVSPNQGTWPQRYARLEEENRNLRKSLAASHALNIPQPAEKMSATTTAVAKAVSTTPSNPPSSSVNGRLILIVASAVICIVCILVTRLISLAPYFFRARCQVSGGRRKSISAPYFFSALFPERLIFASGLYLGA